MRMLCRCSVTSFARSLAETARVIGFIGDDGSNVGALCEVRGLSLETATHV